MRQSFSPGVALVTGGARRIGRAICLALGEAGWAVVVHTRRPGPEADALGAELIATGARCACVVADLARPEEVETLVARAAVLAGPLTLLVNNASVFEDDAVGALEPNRWDRHFAV